MGADDLAEARLEPEDRDSLESHRVVERRLWTGFHGWMFLWFVVWGALSGFGASKVEIQGVAEVLGLGFVFLAGIGAPIWWYSRRHPNTRRALRRLKAEKRSLGAPGFPRAVYVLERVGDA
jgi:hypothetical protein